MSSPARRRVGLEAIILYKLIKAAVLTVVGVLALVLLNRGAEAAAATLAQEILELSTGAWALRIARLIVMGATTRHVKLAAFAAFADAAVSLVEGLALRAGKWWAPWLVVVGTATLLPFEVVHFARRPGWGRAAILLINLAIVAYLVREGAREHHDLEERAHEHEPHEPPVDTSQRAQDS